MRRRRLGSTAHIGRHPGLVGGAELVQRDVEQALGGEAGAAVSCVSLVLTDQAMRRDDRIRLVYGALEAGINTFELSGRDPEVAAALGEALSAVERRMVFVMQRVGWNRDGSGRRIRDLGDEGLSRLVEQSVAQARLGQLDVAIVDVADDEVLEPQVLAALKAMKAAGAVAMLGVAGGEGVDRHLDGRDFEVLCTPFNVRSGWRERNRLRQAVAADMPIVGCDFHPFAASAAAEEEQSPSRFNLAGMFRRGPRKAAPTDAYAFLERTPNWSAEEICLGYALTEPSLTTVQVRARTVEHLNRLAAIAEKELPNGVAAQIEMARFSAPEDAGAA
jgi:aryl-alcohol dehydrogenase-like predicted oxidoreductase